SHRAPPRRRRSARTATRPAERRNGRWRAARRCGRRAALHLPLRLSAGRVAVRADRLRRGGARWLRLGAGRFRRRDRDRRGRVAVGCLHRAGFEEFIRLRNLFDRRSGPAPRPAGEAMKVVALVAAALVLVWPLIVRGPYPQHLMILVLLNALLGTAWNILGGFAGQISLGQAIFFGAGRSEEHTSELQSRG